jgi:hypothetical protein
VRSTAPSRAGEKDLSDLEPKAERLEALKVAKSLMPPLESSPGWGATARGALYAEHVYRPDGKASFFRDAFLARYQGDPDAADRISRNQKEAMVDVDIRADITSVGGAVGLIPPGVARGSDRRVLSVVGASVRSRFATPATRADGARSTGVARRSCGRGRSDTPSAHSGMPRRCGYGSSLRFNSTRPSRSGHPDRLLSAAVSDQLGATANLA